METLHIRKMAARYHLPPSAQAERERLDRLLRELLESSLEMAIERAGVSASEEICLCHLYVPVRLRLSSGDAALAAAWSLALAEAIRRAASGAPVAGLVRYTSRVQAFVDMAAAASAGNFERVWAWREVGIWRAGDAPGSAEAAQEVVRALLSEPSAIVPVLSALAGPALPTGTLARLASALPQEHWTRLARAALEAAVAPGEVLAQSEPGIAEVSRQARRVLQDSALARALGVPPQGNWQTRLTSEATVRRAITVLIALEADPGILRGGGVRARAIVGTVADALYPALARMAGPSAPEPAEAEPRASAGTQPQAPSVVDATTSRQQSVASVREAVPDTWPPHTTGADPEESTIPHLRRRAFTRYGGLLFLLQIVADLALAGEIAGQPALATRSFRWRMHQLGLTLVSGAEADDPAVLAFAGLLPESVPPSRGEAPPAEAERTVLEALSGRIGENLRERMERDDETLASISLRQAEIVADPGWIEVRLALCDVTTAVRRAGLDLDPGYVPWLGMVVRFVYE